MAVTQVTFMSKSLMRNVTINAIVPVDKLQFTGMPVREKNLLRLCTYCTEFLEAIQIG